MATITVEGNLTKDLEVHISEQGNVWVTGRLMENFNERQEDGSYEELRALGYDFVVFKSQAEHAAASLHKGDRVIVTGELEPNDYRKSDGDMFIGERIVVKSISVSLRYNDVAVIKAPKTEASQAQ